MPIDHKGTSPGLVHEEAAELVLHMRCRNPNCDSINCIEFKAGSTRASRMYQCCKCKQCFGISVGGSIDL